MHLSSVEPSRSLSLVMPARNLVLPSGQETSLRMSIYCQGPILAQPSITIVNTAVAGTDVDYCGRLKEVKQASWGVACGAATEVRTDVKDSANIGAV